MRILFITSFQELFLVNILLLLPLLIFGLIFSIMKKGCSMYLRKSIGYSATLIFGIIGVPLHEISHLIMCLIFRHKVTQVSLFRPKKGRYDNILGFVKHKYNANNIYQTTGCFFIGIAPMVFGSSIIVIILHFLFPTLISDLIAFSGQDPIQLNNLSNTFFYNAKLILSTVFSPSNFFNPYYWLSMYFIVSITLHLTISKADFDNALSGFALLELIIFIFILCGNIFNIKTATLLNYLEQVSSILLSVLFISFLIFGVVYLISYLLYHLFHLH